MGYHTSMEQNHNKEWHTTEATDTQMRVDDESLLRAVNLIVAKEGSFRTDESWVHLAVEPLVSTGALRREGSVISVGNDFEKSLVAIAEVDARYQETLLSYRSLVSRKASEYGVIDTDIYDKLASIESTDEKIMFLCGTLAETSGKLKVALEKADLLESKLKEVDLSLTILESISYDEDENTDS